MSITIREESAGDAPGIRQVHIAAFPSDEEAGLVDALRATPDVAASLVAVEDESLVGHILFSRVTIIGVAGRSSPVALAPMAVLPGRQRQGIGSRLVRGGLSACRQAGVPFVVVLGHPDYYPRFGFSAAVAERLVSPFGGGPAWMALELIPGALSGVAGRVEFAEPFDRFS